MTTRLRPSDSYMKCETTADIVGHTEIMSRLGGEQSLGGVGAPVRVWAVREKE